MQINQTLVGLMILASTYYEIRHLAFGRYALSQKPPHAESCMLKVIFTSVGGIGPEMLGMRLSWFSAPKCEKHMSNQIEV
jgi:hypothetical protein